MPEVVKTLDDLARLANVSAATVSRALRDNPAVNAKTKQKILRLAVEHGFPFQRYSPTGALNAEGCISVVIPPPLERQSRLFDPFLMELLAAIAEAALRYDGQPFYAPQPRRSDRSFAIHPRGRNNFPRSKLVP